MRFALALTLLAPLAAQTPAPCGLRMVVAHRGASAERPENTLASFRRAIQAGAQAIEADPRLTSDLHLISLHDPRLDRTTNGTGLAAQLTLAHIRSLDAGAKFSPAFSNEPVPTLAEILALARGKSKTLLDLKEDGPTYLDSLAAEIRRHNDAPHVLAGVRSLAQIAYFQKHLPTVELIGLAPTPADIQPFLNAGVKTIRLWPDWTNNPALLDTLRAAHASLLLTADTGAPEAWARIAPLHPALVFTNHPARLLETLHSACRP